MTDATSKKLTYPSATRNYTPIADCLANILPDSGTILEIASGSGQHVASFAAQFPDLAWQPSDQETAALASIRAWRVDVNLPNLKAPLNINVMREQWWQDIVRLQGELTRNRAPIKGLIATNMVHISPWEASMGLLQGAGELLSKGGFLYLYGPYRIDGQHTTGSNEAFDRDLKSRNPSWGVRDRDELRDAALSQGLALEATTPMPANNFSLIFRKTA